MMARLKEWVDDTSGALATSGTGAAYTLTTNQVFTSFAVMSNATLTFYAHTTNTGACTLNVDGLGAKPLRSASGSDLGAGVIVAGSVYRVTYFLGIDQLVLHGFYGNAFNIPVGAALDWFNVSPPNSNFVFPFGQAISRTIYSVLFGLLGTAYGTGDGSTTFNIPDLRGRVTAGVDNMGGVAAGRIGSVVTDSGTIVGTTLGSVGGSATHAITQAQLPAVSPTFTGTTQSPSVVFNANAKTYTTIANNYPGGGGGPTPDASTSQTLVGTVTFTPGGTISALGSGSATPLLQPTFMCNKIMRII
jgi:microcystin-dependent protein